MREQRDSWYQSLLLGVERGEILKHKLRSEKVSWKCFRTRVRLPSSPPNLCPLLETVRAFIISEISFSIFSEHQRKVHMKIHMKICGEAAFVLMNDRNFIQCSIYLFWRNRRQQKSQRTGLCWLLRFLILVVFIYAASQLCFIIQPHSAHSVCCSWCRTFACRYTALYASIPSSGGSSLSPLVRTSR